MSRLNRIPAWMSVILIGLVAAGVRLYVSAAHPGITSAVPARSYIFWAVVLAPVAYLADMLIRTTAEYPAVQRAVVRVRTRR